MKRTLLLAAFVGLIGFSTAARAQDAMPSPQAAAAEHSQEQATAEGEGEGEGDGSGYPAHSWEMPAIQVEGVRASRLREEQRIGSYQQPRWTAVRRFPTTRIYVVPAGKMEFEWWNRWQAPLEGFIEDRKIKSQYEFEMGLGHRLQLDLYLQTVQEEGNAPGQGGIHIDEEKFEIRYALADWGVIPGNPTIYLEWARHNDDVDFLESKLLFGGEITTGWHWGANLVFERGLGGANEAEYQVVGGIGHTLVDEQVSLGLEAKVAFANDRTTDFGEGKEVLGGPSLSWNPVPPMHVLFTPLFGVEMAGDESEGRFEGWLITGWAF